MCGLQVDKLVKFVRRHEELMSSFDIDRLKAHMENLERRITVVEGTQGHFAFARCSFIISCGLDLIKDATNV